MAGQTIHVAAPDGRLNEIIVPEGFGPGSTFTVEFADTPPHQQKTTTSYNTTTNQYNNTAAPISSSTTNNNNYDDGFATGFQDPNYIPQPIAAPESSYNTTTTTTPGRPSPNLTPYVTTTTTNNNNLDLNSYPTATDAKPVYNTAPQYPASSY